MLISERLVFVHNPRTGGVSARDYLQRAIPDVYKPAADTSLTDKEKVWLNHQGLGVAHQYAQKLGLDPLAIPTLVCIRNPYSLTLSGYLYLLQRFGDKLKEEERTFPAYLDNMVQTQPAERLDKMASFPFGPFTGFLMVGKTQPSNLTVARTETLAEDLESFVRQLTGARPAFDMPHKNTTEHDHFSVYYTSKEEEIVYRMYRNTFESGLYKRYEGLAQLGR